MQSVISDYFVTTKKLHSPKKQNNKMAIVNSTPIASVYLNPEGDKTKWKSISSPNSTPSLA